jgi:cytochrome oxidase Cu insertion factor (SCO1/SenC/PrrC family)
MQGTHSDKEQVPPSNQRRRWPLYALLLATSLAGYVACSWWSLETRPPPVPISKSAPDFSLTDQDGKRVELSKLHAQGPVVVLFYRGHW